MTDIDLNDGPAPDTEPPRSGGGGSSGAAMHKSPSWINPKSGVAAEMKSQGPASDPGVFKAPSVMTAAAAAGVRE